MIPAARRRGSSSGQDRSARAPDDARPPAWSAVAKAPVRVRAARRTAVRPTDLLDDAPGLRRPPRRAPACVASTVASLPPRSHRRCPAARGRRHAADVAPQHLPRAAVGVAERGRPRRGRPRPRPARRGPPRPHLWDELFVFSIRTLRTPELTRAPLLPGATLDAAHRAATAAGHRGAMYSSKVLALAANAQIQPITTAYRLWTRPRPAPTSGKVGYRPRASYCPEPAARPDVRRAECPLPEGDVGLRFGSAATAVRPLARQVWWAQSLTRKDPSCRPSDRRRCRRHPHRAARRRLGRPRGAPAGASVAARARRPLPGDPGRPRWPTRARARRRTDPGPRPSPTRSRPSWRRTSPCCPTRRWPRSSTPPRMPSCSSSG